MRTNAVLLVVYLAVFLSGAALVGLYNYPPFYERLDGYFQDYRVRIHRVLYPPEEIVFVPEGQVDPVFEATLGAWTQSVSGLLAITETPRPAGTSSGVPSPTAASTAILTTTPEASSTSIPTPTPTSIPDSIALSGVRNEVETRNNCGPATLAMALSFWGWQGDQATVQAVLRPYEKVDDKNVNPSELVAYVREFMHLRAEVRVGGDLQTLKALIAAGFPVIVEKGHTTTGWIGHYILLTGYEDSQAHFLSQDSLIVDSDVPVLYEELVEWWRHFNYLYILVYPPEREADVLSVLGPHADPAANYRLAAEKAGQEADAVTGRDRFFALYNLGSSLAGLSDYDRAAAAFDTAFSEVYPGLGKEERPWRALWYRTDPYQVYFEVGRYQDVIRLADATLLAIGNPVLEETFYWRGRAREASGDVDGAVADYETAVRLNPNSTPASERLRQLRGD